MSKAPVVAGPSAITPAGLANLTVVYLGWSGTYLAIRIAVREGAGFSPLFLAGTRLLVAGLILLLLALWAKNRIRLSRNEWPVLVTSALLLWLGGNGLVVWGEQRADSGYAALLVGSTPIWVALIESVLDRRAPTRLLLLSLAIGFGGLVVLAAPTLQGGTSADIPTLLALIGAPVAWGAGSILQSRRPLDLQPFASSALQHLVGAAGFLVLIVAVQEPRPAPTTEAWLAWAYLVVVGSVITFTSFIQALRLLPTSVVFTYAYVNPVGALLLGWIVLREPLTVWTIGGAALVLFGVAGVFRDRQSRAGAA